MWKMQRRRGPPAWSRCVATLAFACAMANPCLGATVFESGIADGADGSLITFVAPADDFRLAERAEITGATIQVQGLYANDAAVWTGALEWAFFSSGADDRPDSLLLHGIGQNIERAMTTSMFRASVTFDFGDTFLATEGVPYFLAIHALGVSQPAHTGLRWSTAARDPHAHAAGASSVNFFRQPDLYDIPILESFGVSGPPSGWRNPWTGYTADLAFTLHGEVVPEPGTALLVAAGLGVLGARQRSCARKQPPSSGCS